MGASMLANRHTLGGDSTRLKSTGADYFVGIGVAAKSGVAK